MLQFHAALGGSAILLSATLPQELRRTFIDAYRDGLSAAPAPLIETDYPLATIAGADSVREIHCDPRKELPRSVRVTRLGNEAEAVQRIVAAADAGAAVAWVRNSVDDAHDAVQLLRAAGTEPILFHARFAMHDRLQIENEVLRRFGRDSSAADRRQVLVATQVVEQSLDIDFDLMVSDLAPADLLIQRAGRLQRHNRGSRCVSGPELLILSPAPVGDPGEQWIRSVLPRTGTLTRTTRCYGARRGLSDGARL